MADGPQIIPSRRIRGGAAVFSDGSLAGVILLSEYFGAAVSDAECVGAAVLGGISASASAVHGVAADAGATLPVFSASSTARHGVACDGVATVKGISATATARLGVSASGDASLSALSASGTALVGRVADGAVILLPEVVAQVSHGVVAAALAVLRIVASGTAADRIVTTPDDRTIEIPVDTRSVASEPSRTAALAGTHERHANAGMNGRIAA